MYSGIARHWPKALHFGPGAVRRLPDVMTELDRRRAFVVCGRTVAGGVMLERVRGALGAMLVGVFDRVTSHNPYSEVAEAHAMAIDSGADAIVSVGGGSAIDLAKGVVIRSAVGDDLKPYQIEFGDTGSMERRRLPAAEIAHIAVPTTAGSGSDVLPTAAIRDLERGRKLLFWDDRLVPDAVVMDPEMAVHAGPELTAATGMTAMARAIECLYSAHRQPISTGLALHAVRLLMRALPRSIEAPGDVAARADCQMAAVMSATASINAMVSLVHAIGHGVGGRFGLQHGISHAILLAPAMDLLLPAIGADQVAVLEALGGGGGGGGGLSPDESGRRAAELVRAMVEALPLPATLGEVGMTPDQVPELAALTMADYMIANLPRPVTRDEVAALLERTL